MSGCAVGMTGLAAEGVEVHCGLSKHEDHHLLTKEAPGQGDKQRPKISACIQRACHLELWGRFYELQRDSDQDLRVSVPLSHGGNVL